MDLMGRWMGTGARALAGLALAWGLGGLAVAPARAALIVDIQPVRICLDDGSSCGAMTFNAAALQNFWLTEAGITLNILAARDFNSTAFQTMDSVAEVQGFLFANPSPDPAAPAISSQGTITVWFAGSGFSPPGSVELSLQGGNRSWIASNLSALDQTTWMAHGLGHVLGLPHVSSDFTNLMFPSFGANTDLSILDLDPSQAFQAQSSAFVREGELVSVPAPAALGLFTLGLAALVRRRRR